MIKALLKRGGQLIEINQLCNDWATYTMDGKPKVAKITTLAFDSDGMDKIRELEKGHHLGLLFKFFRVADRQTIDDYKYHFKKILR